MILELVAIFVTLLIIFNIFEKRPKGFPPGPKKLPLIGHLHLLGAEPHKTLIDWQKSYGPIIGIWFGSFRSVVINDVKLIKEALNHQGFSGRPKLDFFIARCGGESKGIVFAEGHRWTEQRRFTIRNLRDFGFGTKTITEKVQDEITELLRFKSSAGKPLQVKNVFNNAVMNALWSILFGERLSYDDPEVQGAFKKLSSLMDDTSLVASLSMFMPWLNKIAPKLSGFENSIKDIKPIKRFLDKQLAEHRENYVPDQPKDFVDVYTDEINKTKDPQSSFHENRREIVEVLFDLFVGGSETTSTTLSWLLLYLIHNPGVQKKLQAEIDRVVGKERLPMMADRVSMPYAEAVINETMRFSSLIPLGVFHSTTVDVDFHGYFIPKDTMIVTNFYGVHHNKDSWGDPENFRPERFIDDNSGKFKKSENLIPFSTGKRVCLGEGLGRDELFLFTTNLFQAFDVSPAGKTLPTLEPHIGITSGPQAFEVILTLR